MKVALFVFAAVAAALAAPPVSEPIPIVRQVQEVNFDGTYQNSYETGNGIVVDEQGVVRNPGTKEQAAEVTGSVRYTAPGGEVIALSYVANENGYQAQGDHLPVAPTPHPVPEYILRALEYIAAHPQPEETRQA